MWTKALLMFLVAAAAARPKQQQLSDQIQQALNSGAVQSVLKDIQEVGKSFQPTNAFEGIQRMNSVAFEAALKSSPPDSRLSIQDSQGLVNSILETVGIFIQSLPTNASVSGTKVQEIPIVPDISSLNKLIQGLSSLNGSSTTPAQIPAIPPIQVPGFPPIQIPAIPPIQVPGFPPIQIPAIQPAGVPAPGQTSATRPVAQPIAPTAVVPDVSAFPDEYQEPTFARGSYVRYA